MGPRRSHPDKGLWGLTGDAQFGLISDHLEASWTRGYPGSNKSPGVYGAHVALYAPYDFWGLNLRGSYSGAPPGPWVDLPLGIPVTQRSRQDPDRTQLGAPMALALG